MLNHRLGCHRHLPEKQFEELLHPLEAHQDPSLLMPGRLLQAYSLLIPGKIMCSGQASLVVVASFDDPSVRLLE